jgi:hypothetical protein
MMVCRLILVFTIGCGVAWTQQPIGTVGVQNANIAGALEVNNGRAILVGNTTVTARDHTAEIELKRGGTVRVCATSGLHLTSGQGAAGAAPLMLALDRGAIEVQMPATTRDMVMTPDLRFMIRGDGPLDLQLRVTRNGDTCVENRGAQAPVLNIADQFGEAAYELKAGQHVLFEHGSLKEVVDHESSSCGCPPEPAMTVADALLNAGNAGTPGDAKTAAELHPFPAAISAGLAPAPIPEAPAGALHEQVSATLNSGNSPDSTTEPPGTPEAKNTTTPATANAPQSTTEASAPAAIPPRHGFAHAIGRFFRKIFGS